MTLISRRRSLLVAASSLALGFASGAAAEDAAGAAGTAAVAEDLPGIVIRNDISPNGLPPSGAWDPVNITGVGQVVTDQQNGFVGTCTGTLINPRTVIFAAHCVNTRAASAYGAAGGGTPISVGFQQANLSALRRWLGLDGAPAPYLTDTTRAIYNVENVWYDERSRATGFLEADIALATLDTPAFGIPTWAMLFTPLEGQEHVTITGYGSIGNGTTGYTLSGGFRRRVAENHVSFLGSLNDRNAWLFGTNAGLPQNLYMSAFTSPAGWDPSNPTNPSYDFGIFGDDDTVLPREGTTGSGDSGGPLILDRKYDIPLILGVLSGGSRFFAPQAFGAYGTHSFYQPLHAFWDTIVANNPYVYATNKAGDGEWTDPGHWVQAMDPAYQVVIDGKLVNGVPSVAGEATSGAGTKFGDVCFLGDCFDFTDIGDSTVEGDPFFVAGGPGSENFVPDNITANPAGGIRPRYYDVTLSAPGTTTLRGANVTVDLLTLAGSTGLDVKSGASLRSLGEFNQIAGRTNVDGLLQASEAYFLTGFLTGTGTVKAPWVTTAAATIAPGGGDRFGTLTIDGNLVMTSGSALFIDASRKGSDVLAVTGLLSLSDPSDPASMGPSLVFNKLTDSPAPRHGQKFTIATAGTIEGKFGKTFSFQGVLRPDITYDFDKIVAELRAGALVEIIEGDSPTAIAFASALDQLRSGSYNALWNLYGMIDLMDGASLAATLDGLAPRLGTASSSLQQRQSRVLAGAIGDRLSVMGSGADGTITYAGAPDTLMMGLTGLTGQRNVRMGIADLAPGGQSATKLPEGFSGFVSGGVFGGREAGSASLADGSQYGSYFGMGLEREVDARASFGFAVGHASGRETTTSGLTEARTTQVAAYGSYRLGGNAYLGGVASMDTVDLETQRSGFDGAIDQRLHGASGMTRYAATAEVGVNVPLANGLTLTPRAQLGYERVGLAGYTENGTQAALRIDGLKMASVNARTGFKLAGSNVDVGAGWTLIPQLKGDYVRRISGGNDGLTVRFAAADEFAIALPLANGDASWGELRGGATMVRGNLSFGAGFETAIDREGSEDTRAMVDFAVSF